MGFTSSKREEFDGDENSVKRHLTPTRADYHSHLLALDIVEFKMASGLILSYRLLRCSHRRAPAAGHIASLKSARPGRRRAALPESTE